MRARNSIFLAAIASASGAGLPARPVQAQHWFQDLTTIGLE